MTEYEIADLAVSQALEIQGLFTLLHSQIESRDSMAQQFMTVLFSFIVAVHFIGARLNRVQALLFAGLYIFWQFWTLSVHALRGFSMRVILDDIRSRDVLVATDQVVSEGFAIALNLTATGLMLLALLASLYFMWNVRTSGVAGLRH